MSNLEEHYHWLYSTLAQSLAALIGITGVFVVFRLQALTDDLRKKFDVFIGYLEWLNSTSGYESLTKEELLSTAKGIIEVDEGIIAQLRDDIEKISKNLDDQTDAIEKKRRTNLKHEFENKLRDRIHEVNKIQTRMQNILDIQSFSKIVRVRFMWVLGYLFLLFLCSFFFLSMANSLANNKIGSSVEMGISWLLVVGIVVLAIICISSIRVVGEK